MYGFSRKEIINRPTPIYRKDNLVIFMSLANQLYLTKKVYQIHARNNGLLQYLDFKIIIPARMKEWISKKDINHYRQIPQSLDMLDYLNKLFVEDNSDLYSYDIKRDSNVYRDVLSISTLNMTDLKRPNELLAEDMRNLDVWTSQTTEVNNRNMRYGNAIPAWQRTMNIRHYDKSNQGFSCANPNRSSLDTPIYGYGNEMQKLYKMVDQKLKKDKKIDTYYN